MLDEPTEGLAPVIIQQIGRTIAELKREGFTILLVEQNFRFAATVADRFYRDGARPDHRRLRQRRACRQRWTSCTTISACERASRRRDPIQVLPEPGPRPPMPSRSLATTSCGSARMMPPRPRHQPAAALRPAADRPHQRLVLRAAQPRPRRHLRHAEHRQFRPWRVLHDGRLRRLFPAAVCAASTIGAR